jgi:hypothetical protein
VFATLAALSRPASAEAPSAFVEPDLVLGLVWIEGERRAEQGFAPPDGPHSRGATSTGLMGLRGRVVDATTLAFDRDVANDDPLSIAWYAIELPEGTRVQRATTSFASAQTTASAVISPVDLTRSMALGGAVYYRGGKSPSLVDIRGVDSFTFDLTSPTSLTLERFVGGATADVEWQVVELPP